MGWSKLTKSIGDNSPQKIIRGKDWKDKISRRTSNAQTIKPEYDYKEDIYDKGSLRKDMKKKQAYNIYEDSRLNEQEKQFKIQKLIDEEKIHQSKFTPDTQRKQYLRDKLLNKDQTIDQRFDKYTDGSIRTKE